MVTELPYGVGPEKVITRIKDLVQAKKITGISDLKDLTDRNRGLNLVIEVRAGFNPEAVLAELYRLTPMEETFGINNVALVDGQPRTLGLRELLGIYVEHRLDVTRRRSEFRRSKRQDRLHLVDGILIALLNIDEVIQVIRTSDDSAAAKQRLCQVFDLTEIQAQYILDTPLRRLTRFDKLELEREQETLRAEIAELTEILENEDKLRDLVSGEMADVAKKFGTPRRTVLMEAGAAVTAAVPLEVTDDPCLVVLSATGLLSRIPLESHSDSERVRGFAAPATGIPKGTGAADLVACSVATTARATIGAVTSAGRMIRVSVIEIPASTSAGAGTLSAGHPVAEFVPGLADGETVLALASLDGGDASGVVLGTASGVVKRVQPDYPANRDEFELITLKDDDRVIGAAYLTGDDAELVFITSDAQLLRFAADLGPPAGPPGRRHGRRPAVRRRHRPLVRRHRPRGHQVRPAHPARQPAQRARGQPRGRHGGHGRPARRADRRRGRRRRVGNHPGGRDRGRGHGGGPLRRTARHRRRVGQGDPVRRVPAQGPRDRRRPLPALPQGRGRPDPGLDRPGPGHRRDRVGRHGRPVGHDRQARRLRQRHHPPTGPPRPPVRCS